MAQKYEYKLVQCDVSVEDRKALDTYRSKRLLWQLWIDDDAHHAIWQVLHGMVWQDVVMRSFTDIAVNDPSSALHNSLLTESLLNGHVATQVLGIRRLIENGSSVLSLRRLLKDIRKNASLITRENFVCFDGLPYDYAKVRDEEMTAQIKVGAGGGFWAARTGPTAWAASEQLHQQFDRMSGVDPANRQRSDGLAAIVLETIERWLNESGAKELADWSHVYLAHAGNPEERKKIEHLQITASNITGTIRALCRITEAISLWVVGISSRSTAVMPVAQYNPFEQLEQPVMQLEAQDDARALWHDLEAERNAWLSDIEPELLRSPGATL